MFAGSTKPLSAFLSPPHIFWTSFYFLIYSIIYGFINTIVIATLRFEHRTLWMPCKCPIHWLHYSPSPCGGSLLLLFVGVLVLVWRQVLTKLSKLALNLWFLVLASLLTILTFALVALCKKSSTKDKVSITAIFKKRNRYKERSDKSQGVQFCFYTISNLSFSLRPTFSLTTNH